MKGKKMKAYTLTISKEEFVTELKKHREADNFIRGTYWRDGKGCAVGCGIESISRTKGIELAKDDHAEYERHLGIPEWLARVEDGFFENMSVEKSKDWPVRFAEAIHPGADLEKVKTPFIIMLLEHALASVDAAKFDAEKFPEVAKAVAGSKAAVLEMIAAHREGRYLSAEAARSAARSAEEAAWSAARSAWSAARSAARSAWSAAWSAEEAARSAARSAEEAAWSAARSAARSAEEAAWSAARSAAWSAAYDYYAERLLEMLSECKPETEVE
jgi:hypothetical protein